MPLTTADASQLHLRTLNPAQSAFVVFTLHSGFFAEYLVASGTSSSVELHLKNLVSIFRSTTGVSCVWLQLSCNGEEQAYVRVQLQCTSGVRKKFDIALKEVRGFGHSHPRPHRSPNLTSRCTRAQVTPMSAIYSKENCEHRIAADPAKIISCISNFPSNLPEVRHSLDRHTFPSLLPIYQAPNILIPQTSCVDHLVGVVLPLCFCLGASSPCPPPLP